MAALGYWFFLAQPVEFLKIPVITFLTSILTTGMITISRGSVETHVNPGLIKQQVLTFEIPSSIRFNQYISGLFQQVDIIVLQTNLQVEEKSAKKLAGQYGRSSLASSRKRVFFSVRVIS